MTGGGFEFTDTQRKEIEASLAAADLPTGDSRFSLGEHLEFIRAYCSGGYSDPRIERRWYEESLMRLDKEILIIKEAVAIRLSYEDEASLLSGESSMDEAVSWRNFRRYLEENRYYIVEKIETSDPIPGNNFRPFQDELQSHVASCWISAGGKINGRKEYRRFFEAIVRPVLTDRQISAQHRVAWTESTFDNHVKIVFDRIPPF